MVKHKFGVTSSTSKGEGHPIMYGAPQGALLFESFPDGGGYPKRFLEWVFDIMQVEEPAEVLHLCSGSVRSGWTVDIRSSVKPLVVADVRHLPFRDNTFNFVLADPPYDKSYAQNLYGVGSCYPKPGEVLKEAARVVRPGGLIGLLHFIVPVTRRPLKIVKVYGITTGNGTAIRAWTLLRKILPDEQVTFRNGT